MSTNPYSAAGAQPPQSGPGAAAFGGGPRQVAKAHKYICGGECLS